MSVAIDYTSGAFAANKAQGVGTITGSDIDLSSGQYFDYTPTADTTFTFSNAPASGTAAGFALAVTGANVVSGYDLANASYDSVSFSVAAQDTIPSSVSFKPDGTKMYVAGTANDTIYQYSLSTAWDVSTLSYDTVSFSVASQAGQPKAFFKPDGTKFYVADNGTDAVYQYSMSTAWDLSSASYDSVSVSVSSQDSTPQGVSFSSDGTKMYIVGFANTSIFQYSLSTAWDLSSASYDSVSFDFSSQETQSRLIILNPDGTKMFLIGTDNDSVFQYSLSTAFDVSSASYDSISFSVAAQETIPLSLAFKSDGSKMYVVGSGSDTIYQYTTGSSAPATFTYPSSVDWPSGTAPDAPADGETDVLVFYTDDGGTTYYGFQAGDAMA